MLQVYTLELIVDDSLHSCKLDISGFVAIRDFLDGRRNYIFNRGIVDPLTAASENVRTLIFSLVLYFTQLRRISENYEHIDLLCRVLCCCRP